jgi:hypothetical protein
MQQCVAPRIVSPQNYVRARACPKVFARSLIFLAAEFKLAQRSVVERIGARRSELAIARISSSPRSGRLRDGDDPVKRYEARVLLYPQGRRRPNFLKHLSSFPRDHTFDVSHADNSQGDR